MTSRHLVLAGAGHAQLDLLAALVRERPVGWRVSLVTPQPDFHYSGMLPGIIAGTIPPHAATIPVAAIARAAGIEVHLASVTALDVASQSLSLGNGATVPFDLLSLDVGGSVAGLGTPGARAHAYAMRPLSAPLALITRLDSVFRQRARGEAIPVVVVGAGAGGVEIALAIAARVRRAGYSPEVTIIDAAATHGLPLPEFAHTSRAAVSRALEARGVTMVQGSVVEVREDAVMVNVQQRERSFATVATAWVSGAAPHAWLAAGGLRSDAAGYPLASRSLQLASSAGEVPIFGAGDCVVLRDAPDTPKAGVYAVRMAPVLAANVLAAARGTAARRAFLPQRAFLAILSTGDGAAILRWRGVTVESRWAQALKTWIDTRYLQRYRRLAPT